MRTPQGSLTAWNTFGPAVVLLMLAAVGGLALALATVTERTTALPVAAAIWGIFLGFVGTIARDRAPARAPRSRNRAVRRGVARVGGALAVLVGCWQSIRDERTELYTPAEPPLRPRRRKRWRWPGQRRRSGLVPAPRMLAVIDREEVAARRAPGAPGARRGGGRADGGELSAVLDHIAKIDELDLEDVAADHARRRGHRCVAPRRAAAVA